jgi:cyclohexadieny/prephenate dehydrogenase
MKRIAIVGPGLLGGSLALKLHALGGSEVRLWARRPEAIQEIEARKCADFASTDLREVAGDADLIVLCVPVNAMGGLAREMHGFIRPDTIITDVGSVKASVVNELGRILATRGRFVGSHPMAGNERTGLRAADANLFQGTTCMVTPDDNTDPIATAEVAAFWRRVGCRVVQIAAREHDECVALISHLPHLIAGALIHAVAGKNAHAFQVVGPGFRDTTRVASGPPGMWVDILRENAPAVLASLDAIMTKLAELRGILASPTANAESLRNFLAVAKQTRDQIQFPK